MFPHIGCFCETDCLACETLWWSAEHHHQSQLAKQGKSVWHHGVTLINKLYQQSQMRIRKTVHESLFYGQVLGIVAGVLLIDHDVRGTEFQQVLFGHEVLHSDFECFVCANCRFVNCYNCNCFVCCHCDPKSFVAWNTRCPTIGSSSCSSWNWTPLTRFLRRSTSRCNLVKIHQLIRQLLTTTLTQVLTAYCNMLSILRPAKVVSCHPMQ